tara:strand:+ start:1418 stop:2161 length:744 start_codon:yes stop_codon:yes gene_type:complete
MKFIKYSFLLFFLFILSSALINVFLDNLETTIFLGLLLSFFIVLKPHKYIWEIGNGKKLFSRIPDQTIEHHRNEVIDQFVTGELSEYFPTSIFLKKEEKLIFDIPKIKICEEKTIKSKGNHSEFSLRVMKGVSYRFGGFKASSKKRVTLIDTGHFILTNKRLIFSGTKKSLDISLSKIISTKPLENGILIDRTAKENVEYFIGLDTVNLDMILTPEISKNETWNEQKVKFLLNGFDVRKIIQRLIQE